MNLRSGTSQYHTVPLNISTARLLTQAISFVGIKFLKGPYYLDELITK